MATRREVLGGWYGFATIGGGWAALIGDRNHASHIESSEGRIELPLINGQPDNVLYLTGALLQGRLVMGGQSHGGGFAWLYWHQQWIHVGGAFGVSMVAFSQDGRYMYVADSSTTGYYRDLFTLDHTAFSPVYFYTDGIRAVIPPGNKLILGNTTLSDPARRISEYIDFTEGFGLTVGQGATGLLALSPVHGRRVIEPGGTFFIRAQFDDTNIALATSKQLEQPQKTVFHWLTVDELPQFPIEGDNDSQIVPIGKPCWLGWYEWIEPPQLPPGNCLLRVHELLTIKRLDGTQFAQQVMGDTVEEIEAQCVNTPYPPVAYWDGPDWPRYPVLPAKSWLALQAYGWNTTPFMLEAHLRSLLTSLAQTHPLQRIALVCQCYTNNDPAAPDLAALVPVYARLAKEFASVTMLLVFSDQGRDSGLNDNPALRPVWQELANGITGVPGMANGIENGVVVDPRAYFMSLVAGKDAAQYETALREIENDWYKYGFGIQCDSGCRPRGRVYLPTANCPYASPNAQEHCLGVKQDQRCWEGQGRYANVVSGGQWVWDEHGGPPYQPYQPTQPDPPADVAVLILDYDKTVRRSDPNGMLIRFEAASALPIIQIDLDLVEDNEPSIGMLFSADVGRDGRYIRALAFKPVRPGQYTLRVTAVNSKGAVATKDGDTKVTVID